MFLFNVFSVFLKMHFVFEKCLKTEMRISLQPWRILKNSKNNPALIFDDLYENGNKKLQKNMTFKKHFLNIVNNLLIIGNNYY